MLMILKSDISDRRKQILLLISTHYEIFEMIKQADVEADDYLIDVATSLLFTLEMRISLHSLMLCKYFIESVNLS